MFGLRRKARLRQDIGRFASDPRFPFSVELARQIDALKRGLLVAIDDFGGKILRIVNGNASPKVTLQPRDLVEVAGNLTVEQLPDRIKLTWPDFPTPPSGGLDSITGLDGVDASLPTPTTPVVRASRDIFGDSLSSDQNNYSGTGSATGTPYDTSDYMFIITSGSRSITGMLAPTAGGTIQRIIYNQGTGTLTLPHNSGLSSSGNKFQSPQGISTTLQVGESCEVFYASGFWWILARRPGVTAHNALTGLGANDHTQYLLAATPVGRDGVSISVASQVFTAERSKTVIGPFTLSTDQDNYNPSGWDTADIVIINCTSRIVFTGFKAPTANGTREKWIMMRSNSGSINHYATLSYFDTSSSAANRISCPDSADIDMLKRQVTRIVYDDDLEIWRFDGTDAIQASGTRRWVADQSVGGFGFTDCRDIQFAGQLANPPDEPANDDETTLWQWVNADGNAPGMLSVMPAAGRMILQNVLDYDDDTQIGDDSGTLGWDFADIDGRDLSNGTFKLRALMVAQNVTDPDGDGEYDVVCVERWGAYSRTGAAANGGDSYCKNMEIVATTTKAYWELSGQAGSLDFVPGAGTIVGLDWDLPILTGTDTWHRWIIVTIEGGCHR